jgi:hypothetical protein
MQWFSDGYEVKKSLMRMKTLFFWVATIVPLMVLVEISSYILIVNSVPTRIRGRVGHGTAEFHAGQRVKLGAVPPRFVVSSGGPGHLNDPEDSGLLMFHPALGWDFPPNLIYKAPDGTLCSHGPDGERRTATSFARTAIATYGDSFTYCDEVADDQTWQTILGRKIEANVLNFGVSGYGSDQAFLKFQLHGPPKADVVMLCILPENINRVVNIYRPFYNYEDPLALTKPRFIRDGETFKLIPNPSTEPGSLLKLNDPEYLAKLGKQDYWYQFDRRLPDLSFPYLRAAAACKPYILDELGLVTSRVLPRVTEPQYPFNLFNEPEPFAIMCHIVDLFVAGARERGVQPIIVIMPHRDYVQELRQYQVSRVAKFWVYLKEKRYPFLDAIQAMADMNPTPDELNKWYSGHATAKGNEVLADIIFRYLQGAGQAVAAR